MDNESGLLKEKSPEELQQAVQDFLAKDRESYEWPAWFSDLLKYLGDKEMGANRERTEQDQRGFGESGSDAHADSAGEAMEYGTLLTQLKDMVRTQNIATPAALQDAVEERIHELVKKRSSQLDQTMPGYMNHGQGVDLHQLNNELSMWTEFRDVHLRDRLLHLGLIKNHEV